MAGAEVGPRSPRGKWRRPVERRKLLARSGSRRAAPSHAAHPLFVPAPELDQSRRQLYSNSFIDKTCEIECNLHDVFENFNEHSTRRLM